MKLIRVLFVLVLVLSEAVLVIGILFGVTTFTQSFSDYDYDYEHEHGNWYFL